MKELLKKACTRIFEVTPEREYIETEGRIEIVQRGKNGEEDKRLIYEGGSEQDRFVFLLRTLLDCTFISIPAKMKE